MRGESLENASARRPKRDTRWRSVWVQRAERPGLRRRMHPYGDHLLSGRYGGVRTAGVRHRCPRHLTCMCRRSPTCNALALVHTVTVAGHRMGLSLRLC